MKNMKREFGVRVWKALGLVVVASTLSACDQECENAARNVADNCGTCLSPRGGGVVGADRIGCQLHGGRWIPCSLEEKKTSGEIAYNACIEAKRRRRSARDQSIQKLYQAAAPEQIEKFISLEAADQEEILNQLTGLKESIENFDFQSTETESSDKTEELIGQ